jgi:hypothetical protein
MMTQLTIIMAITLSGLSTFFGIATACLAIIGFGLYIGELDDKAYCLKACGACGALALILYALA